MTLVNYRVQIAEHCPAALLPFAVIALILILAGVLRSGLASAPRFLRVLAAAIVAAVFLFIMFRILDSSQGQHQSGSQTDVSEQNS